jgi:hypothetical protein
MLLEVFPGPIPIGSMGSIGYVKGGVRNDPNGNVHREHHHSPSKFGGFSPQNSQIHILRTPQKDGTVIHHEKIVGIYCSIL